MLRKLKLFVVKCAGKVSLSRWFVGYCVLAAARVFREARTRDETLDTIIGIIILLSLVQVIPVTSYQTKSWICDRMTDSSHVVVIMSKCYKSHLH